MTTNKNDTEILTIVEAALLLRKPVSTLRWWRHRGIGPRSFKLGRTVRYRRHDVLRWLSQQS